jgi:hypothetical protein
MSMPKKHPISRKASQSQARKAGVKVQTSVKAGRGHVDPNFIGGRSFGPGAGYNPPS